METIENLNWDVSISDFLDGDSDKLDFNIGDFDLSCMSTAENRYTKPKLYKPSSKIHFNNAQRLAKEISLKKNQCMHFLLSGNFIMGDFIEALLVEKNIQVEELLLSTLGLSQNNVDSLENLLKNGYVKEMKLMISNYFYSHERSILIPYILEKLDIENRFDLLVIRNHTKIILFNIDDFYITIYGSGNLRSSNCIEQMTIQEDEELYNFYKQFFTDSESHSIIRKDIENVSKDEQKQDSRYNSSKTKIRKKPRNKKNKA
jgi:hypothetical protein